MREPIKFSKVDTEEEWCELQLFAASFDHKIDKTTMTPLIAMRRGSKLIGYFKVITQPIIIPAFHTDPQICSPRDFKESVEQIRAHSWLSTVGHDRYPNGVCWVSLPPEPAVRKEIIKELGFNDTDGHLYQAF